MAECYLKLDLEILLWMLPSVILVRLLNILIRLSPFLKLLLSELQAFFFQRRIPLSLSLMNTLSGLHMKWCSQEIMISSTVSVWNTVLRICFFLEVAISSIPMNSHGVLVSVFNTVD